MAVPATLSHGPSRIIFSEFACVPDNVLLLTSPGEEGTLGRFLFDIWNDEQREDDKWNKGKLGRNVMLDRTLALKVCCNSNETQNLTDGISSVSDA